VPFLEDHPVGTRQGGRCDIGLFG